MAFTRISTNLWHWRPFLACSIEARHFWFAFYTCPQTRALLVGIFSGGLAALAEAVRMPFNEAHEALVELEDRGLVEHDQTHQIIRLTELPDNGERPHNGSALKRWWTGFNMIPRCPIRDRHVALIRWLVGTMSGDHERVWESTFGTVENGSGTYDTVSDTVSPSRQSDLFHSENLRHRVRHGVAHGLGSGSGEGSGSESGEGESEREARFAAGTGVGEPPARPTRSGPLPAPPKPVAFSARAMLEAIATAAGPRWHGTLVDDRLNPALTAVAHQCAAKGVTLADLDLAGRFLREGGLAYRNDLGASWAAKPGSVLDLVATARDWERGDVELEDSGPAKIYPASAFVGGRREL